MSKLSWLAIALLCLTLGLAPFNPPHVAEKLAMLVRGELARLVDWFDLFFHGFPWLLLLVKASVTLKAGAARRKHSLPRLR